jgi:hypothetical protein
MKPVALSLALLFAALMASPADAADAAEALAAWAAATVKPLDWNFVGRSTANGFALYAKEAAQGPDPELKRIWARYEYRQAQMQHGVSVRSAVHLQEFDCESREGHSLESTLYRDNNLAGAATKIGEEGWSIAAPTSAFEVLLHRACGDEQE